MENEDQYWTDDDDEIAILDKNEMNRVPYDKRLYIGVNADDSSSSDSSEEGTHETRCGTYNYKYGNVSGEDDLDLKDVYDYGGAFRVTRNQVANPFARDAMLEYVDEENYQKYLEYLHPKRDIDECLKEIDGSSMTNLRPFSYCPVPHSHGQLFNKELRLKKNTKQNIPTWRRPVFLVPVRRRFGPLWRRDNFRRNLDCKDCDRLCFTHHADINQHYLDYVDQVTYRGENPLTKPSPDDWTEAKQMLKLQKESRQRRKYINIQADFEKLTQGEQLIPKTSKTLISKSSDNLASRRKKVKSASSNGDVTTNQYEHVKSKVDNKMPECFLNKKNEIKTKQSKKKKVLKFQTDSFLGDDIPTLLKKIQDELQKQKKHPYLSLPDDLRV